MYKRQTQKITINYCNVPYTFNVKVAERLYKVIFTDSDGKTVIAEQELKKGQDATAPEAPAKEGYEFTAWDRSFTNVTRDIVVKAVYTKLYKVTFKSKEMCIRDRDHTWLKKYFPKAKSTSVDKKYRTK